jgi:hypothetical protein
VLRDRLAIIGGVLLAVSLSRYAWAGDDIVGPLRESIAAAPLIVEGYAERPYTSWDGADRASIRTYTPLRITRVLKGKLEASRIILRQPGGDVGGTNAVAAGAEFSEGEQAIVFVGRQDPGDSSYDVRSGPRGKFVVLYDESGRAVLEVRLGADASAYTSREKAPGVLLARVPVELFEQLAMGGEFESVAEFERTRSSQSGASPPPPPNNVTQTAWVGSRSSGSSTVNRGLWIAAAALAVLGLAWLARQRLR